jgi:EAL domain-containing protein (putative c-di-GMP-specific phosphodiesterase class I)
MTTVAEGIESEEQLALLREEGCEVAQGYLFSVPLDEDALVQYCGGVRIAA